MMTMIARVVRAIAPLSTPTEKLVNEGCDHECVRVDFWEEGGYVQAPNAPLVVARNTRGVMHPEGTVVLLHRVGDGWAFDS